MIFKIFTDVLYLHKTKIIVSYKGRIMLFRLHKSLNERSRRVENANKDTSAYNILIFLVMILLIILRLILIKFICFSRYVCYFNKYPIYSCIATAVYGHRNLLCREMFTCI